jgi:hypothetical protein
MKTFNLDKINEVQICLKSIADLLGNAEGDSVDREQLLNLLGMFTRRWNNEESNPEQNQVNTCCISAITDMLHPSEDMHLIDRYDFSLLIRYFSGLLAVALGGNSHE